MLSFIPSLYPQPKAPLSKQSSTQNTPTYFQGEATSPSTLNKLLKAGVDRQEASNLNIDLAKKGDFPYHVGRLASGHIFVVTNQDRMFLGLPSKGNKLLELPVQESFRTRCIGNQKRVVESVGGLRVTIEEPNGIRTAKVSKLNTKSNTHEELAVAKPHGHSPLSSFITAKNSPH